MFLEVSTTRFRKKGFDAKAKADKSAPVHCRYGIDRRIVRHRFWWKLPHILQCTQPAAACTARMGLSGCMGHPVRIDGHFCLSNMADGAHQAKTCPYLVRRSAVCKFSLESCIFPFSLTRRCNRHHSAAVCTDYSHAARLWTHTEVCRMAQPSLSVVGRLCFLPYNRVFGAQLGSGGALTLQREKPIH